MKKTVACLLVILLLGLLLGLLAGCADKKETSKDTAIREFIPQEPYVEEALPKMTLQKNLFHRSETIDITCENTDDGDVIFIYREGNSRGDAEPIHQKLVSDGNLSFKTGLMTAGVYVVYLCDDDEMYVHDVELIRIYDEEDTFDYTPRSATVRVNEAGVACVDIQPAAGVETLVEYRLYWSKEGKPLEDYTAVHVASHRGSEPFTAVLSEGLYKPAEADGLTVKAMAGAENSLSTAVPEELSIPESKLVYKYNVLSDMHVSPNWPRCNAMVKKTFRDIIAQGYSSVIFTLGDNTERGQENEYELLNSAIAEAGEKLPNIYYALGNHDIVYNDNAGYDKQLKLFKEQTGMPGAYYAVDVNGYSHIVLGSDTLSHLGTIGQEQQDWLKAELQKADPNKPVFVYMHQPLRDTTSGTLYTKYNKEQEQDSFGFLEDAKALREILKNYPNAIVLTGHTHKTFLSEQPVLLGNGADASFVACSSVGKSSTGAEGIYMEVYEDYVLIRGRDFAQEKWCGSMQIMIPIH